MAANPNHVNPQMQQLADKAVVAARDKFGVALDFTENSLQPLEVLLQQAHEGYKQASSNGNPANIPIENTVRIWGSYFGEVIRRSLGGDWIIDQKNVFLQIGSRRLDPLAQVRSRIVDGQPYDVDRFFQGVKSGNQDIQKQPPVGPIFDEEESQTASIDKGTNKRRVIYIGGIIGALLLVSVCVFAGWFLSRKGMLANLGSGNIISPTATSASTSTASISQVPNLGEAATAEPSATPAPATDTPATPSEPALPSATWTPTPTARPTNTQTFQPELKTIGPVSDSIHDTTYSMQISVTKLAWLLHDTYANPKPGNIYLIVYIQARNLGPGSVRAFGAPDFQVLDANGIVHDYTYLSATMNTCRLDTEDIIPNGVIEGCVTFEVPETGEIQFLFAPFRNEGLVQGRYLSFILRK